MNQELLLEARDWVKAELLKTVLAVSPEKLRNQCPEMGDSLKQILQVRSETVGVALNESQALCSSDDDRWNSKLRQVCAYTFKLECRDCSHSLLLLCVQAGEAIEDMLTTADLRFGEDDSTSDHSRHHSAVPIDGNGELDMAIHRAHAIRAVLLQR